ncbi:MAG: PLP-dependent transferase, partial [Pseudomonadota bacterium]
MSNVHPETFAAQAGGDIDPETGAVVPPIHLATTFEREGDLSYRHGLIYSRDAHPGGMQCERVIDVLEGGTGTRVFASGMAAAVTCLMALPRPCHVIAPNVMYWSLRNWMKNEAASHGLNITFTDMTSLEAVRAALKPGETKLIWAETPSNPTWSISDIAALSELAHDAGALLAVDSTPASPVCTQPLSLGADVVMHSVTKYLNGHSDVLGGSLTLKEATRFAERIAKLRTSHGNNLAGFESALLLRGMRTVHVRVARQCETAMQFAKHFEGDRRVAAVLYP